MALEPDLRFPQSPAASPFVDPSTRFGSQAAPIAPFSPIAPNLPDELQQRINANLAGQQQPAAPDTTGLDTSAIVPNLPNSQAQFIAKYKRLGGSVQQLPDDVRSSLLQLDYNRVQRGQAPLNDKETIGAILTAMNKQQATPQPEDHSIVHTIKNFPGAAVSDAATILKSLPHMPGAIVKEVQALPNFGKELVEASENTNNPVSGLATAPGIRMLPGAFTVGNLAQGPDGIRTLLEHPVMTTLDVLPFASEGAKLTTVGALAEAEKINPIRAVLTRSALPEGELSVAGSRLTPAKLGTATEAFAKTRPGQFMVETWGKGSRMESSIYNMGDHRLMDTLMGKTKLKDRNLITARRAYGFAIDQQAGKFGIEPSRVIDITKALETDRNLLADTTKFTDADRAFASRAIRLQQQFQADRLAANGVGEFGGEIYDAKTSRKMASKTDKLGRATAKVEAGMYERIEAARQEVAAHVRKHGVTPINRAAEARIAVPWSLMDDYFNNFDSTVTMADIEKSMQNLAAHKGRALVIGGKEAPVADLRLDSLIKLRGEVRQAAKLEKDLNKLLDRAPARWHSNVQKVARDTAERNLIEAGVEKSEALRIVAERDFAAYPELYNDKILKGLIEEAEPTWRALKEAGVDPVFIHRVAAGSDRGIALPRTRDFIGELSQDKGRSIFDPTPYNQDITVGLAHQGMEVAAQYISREVLGEIAELRGVTAAELYQRYKAAVRRKAGDNPIYNFEGHLQETILKEWEPYLPESYVKGTRPKGAIAFDANSEQLWIPKSTAKVMEQFYNRTPNAVLSTMAPITGLFRTAVLPLSPRWHINNIMGNTFQTLMEDPKALLKIPEARRIAKAIEAGEETAIPDAIKYSLNLNRQELAQTAYESGRRYGKFFKSLQDAKTANPLSKVIQTSYDFNSKFDDIARLSTYLNEFDKGIGKRALTADAAAVEALHTTNRVFQDWNALTPVERNVLRQIFPFYSFTSHIIRFVTSFPGTHPLRTSIMANIANSIATDMKEEGIPKEMLDYLSLGKADELGHQDFLSLRGMNPMSDTANQFTLAGFLSGINPVGQAVATSLGADISGYGVNARQTYDPDTGKLTDTKPGFAQSLVASTVPQLGTLQRALGMDTEYNELLRTNPDAAKRLLVSGLGIPALRKSISPQQEQMKAEVNRQTIQRQVLARALATNNFDEAMKWPNLRPYIEQIKILSDQRALGAYNPQAGASGGISSIPGAVRSVTPWPT